MRKTISKNSRQSETDNFVNRRRKKPYFSYIYTTRWPNSLAIGIKIRRRFSRILSDIIDDIWWNLFLASKIDQEIHSSSFFFFWRDFSRTFMWSSNHSIIDQTSFTYFFFSRDYLKQLSIVDSLFILISKQQF